MIYDAEHFFDAWADDPSYALQTLRAAADAGAELLCLCDTNGATLPPTMQRVVAEVARRRAARRSACTATTTPTAPWPTRWWR